MTGGLFNNTTPTTPAAINDEETSMGSKLEILSTTKTAKTRKMKTPASRLTMIPESAAGTTITKKLTSK